MLHLAPFQGLFDYTLLYLMIKLNNYKLTHRESSQTLNIVLAYCEGSIILVSLLVCFLLCFLASLVECYSLVTLEVPCRQGWLEAFSGWKRSSHHHPSTPLWGTYLPTSRGHGFPHTLCFLVQIMDGVLVDFKPYEYSNTIFHRNKILKI